MPVYVMPLLIAGIKDGTGPGEQVLLEGLPGPVLLPHEGDDRQSDDDQRVHPQRGAELAMSQMAKGPFAVLG